MHCRHDFQNKIKSSCVQPRYTSEKRFDPWTLVEPPKEQSSTRPILSSVEEEKPICYERRYGWNEIQQNEDEREKLDYLVSIWDLERKAILKLQHDLNKNLFQRFRDYVKRFGQSVGLALGLWVHRPATCSQMNRFQSNWSDDRWLKDFIFDKTEETLPPIARAMKTMIDENVYIENSSRQTSSPWPHYQTKEKICL